MASRSPRLHGRISPGGLRERAEPDALYTVITAIFLLLIWLWETRCKHIYASVGIVWIAREWKCDDLRSSSTVTCDKAVDVTRILDGFCLEEGAPSRYVRSSFSLPTYCVERPCRIRTARAGLVAVVEGPMQIRAWMREVLEVRRAGW
jgi:hypothetical protein